MSTLQEPNSLDAAVLDFDANMIAPEFLPRLPTITTLPLVPLPPPDPPDTDGMHELIKDRSPHTWADVTPASARELDDSTPRRGEEIDPQPQPPKEPQTMHPEQVYPELTAEADPQLLQDIYAADGASMPSPEKEGQDSAEQSAEGADAEDQEDTGQEDGYKRPWWVRDDPNNDMAFWVEHPEMTGRFVVEKPTMRRELALRRIEGREAGAFPTHEGELLAQCFAIISVGFSEIPDDAPRLMGVDGKPSKEIDAGAIIDDDLANALSWEVNQRWRRFRGSKKPQAQA